MLILADKRASRLQRLAATAGLYQQIGLGTEDALATPIAWSFWAHNQSANLADISARVLLKVDPREPPYSPAEMEDLKRKLADNKRIHVDGRRYLRALINGVKARDIPVLFGIRWKPHPSIKLVSKDELEFWTSLPGVLLKHEEILTDPNTQMATACYNKLKHGPQLIVDKPKDAARRMSRPQPELQVMPETELLRILTDGARTEMTREELARSQHVAPFLLDDPDNANRLLVESLMDSSLFMFMLGRYLYGGAFHGHKIPGPPSDPGLTELIAAGFARF